MDAVALAQEEIENLIKIAVVEEAIDISKFATTMLKNILPKVKDDLELEFDKIVVYPGPQPRESADIELYFKNQIIYRINEKTCISGNLKATIRKLKESIKPWEDGLIVVFIYFVDKTDREILKTVIFYMPGHIVRTLSIQELYDMLIKKIEEKMADEKYTKYHIVEVTSAIALWRAKQTLIAKEKAEEAAREAKEAKEKAEEAAREAKEAKE
ncbi:MAG: hypothetical protein Q6363_003510, partial [Candidatus Njordarchaeota archaeon]